MFELFTVLRTLKSLLTQENVSPPEIFPESQKSIQIIPHTPRRVKKALENRSFQGLDRHQNSHPQPESHPVSSPGCACYPMCYRHRPLTHQRVMKLL